jgi:RND superfamily putative drug exporter
VVPREHPSPTRIVPPGRTRAATGPLARGYAFVVVSLRYLIIGGWAAAVAAAIVFLPPLNASTGGLSELIPPGSPAAHAESDAAALFGFPLDAGVAVVQRDPHGLTAATQDRAIHSTTSAGSSCSPCSPSR